MSEGKRAAVLQERAGQVFKTLDQMTKRRDEALASLHQKKMELEVRNAEIDELKENIKKLRVSVETKQTRANQMENVLTQAADQFNLIANTTKGATQSAALQDRKATGRLQSAQLSASRGYSCS